MKHILEELKSLKILDDDEIRIVRLESKSTGLSEEDCIIKLGLSTRGTLDKILRADQDISELVVDFSLLNNIPYSFCVSRHCMPVFIKDNCLRIALCEYNINIVQEISEYIQFGHHKTIIFNKDDLYSLIEKSYTNISNWMDCIEASDGSSIEFFINRLLIDAVEQGASDIHMNCQQSVVVVRYRVSGLLKKAFSFHKDYYTKILIRLKVMFLVDITSTFKKRDGRMCKVIFGRSVDFRVSFHSCIRGESVVIRIIQNINQLSLSDLGYNPNCESNIKKMLQSKGGIILIVGPTGCGKTTSMYVALKEIANSPVNIMTIEDPVESIVSFAQQTDINDHPEMNFSNVLRSVYRQDPDVLVIGEVRDRETAQAVVQISMTGHLVLTTLHASNIFTVLDRLVALGLDIDFSLEYVVGIVAQRLLPKVCQHCKGNGCTSCSNSGRLGVCLVSESVVFNHEVRGILKNKNITSEEQSLELERFGYLNMNHCLKNLIEAGLLHSGEAV